jgi:ATP-dependent DNA ligase
MRCDVLHFGTSVAEGLGGVNPTLEAWHQLERQSKLLDGLLSDAPDGILLSQWSEGDGPAIFEAACGLGLEGIISKRLGTKYQSGRCADWLKTKNAAFVRR